MNFQTILLSQFPACFLLSVLFLINYMTVRKRSAVKSVLWVLLFGVALAAAILFCFLGIQAKLWTLSTLFALGVWSWVGLAAVAIVLLLNIAHTIEKKCNRRKIAKALKNAEKQKESAVAQAHEAGRQEGKMEADVAANVADILSAAPAAAEPSPAAESPLAAEESTSQGTAL